MIMEKAQGNAKCLKNNLFHLISFILDTKKDVFYNKNSNFLPFIVFDWPGKINRTRYWNCGGGGSSWRMQSENLQCSGHSLGKRPNFLGNTVCTQVPLSLFHCPYPSNSLRKHLISKNGTCGFPKRTTEFSFRNRYWTPVGGIFPVIPEVIKSMYFSRYCAIKVTFSILSFPWILTHFPFLFSIIYWAFCSVYPLFNAMSLQHSRLPVTFIQFTVFTRDKQ